MSPPLLTRNHQGDTGQGGANSAFANLDALLGLYWLSGQRQQNGPDWETSWSEEFRPLFLLVNARKLGTDRLELPSLAGMLGNLG